MKRHLLIVAALVGWIASIAQADPADLPRKQNIHVYLLMGQSNMAGRGVMTDADREPVDGILMMNAEDQWVAARHPVHFDKSIAGVGMGLPFARAIREANPNVTVALVPCAYGGTPLRRWVKGGDLYANAVRRAKIAAEIGVLKGALWHQGESDSGSAERAEAYGTRLDGMIRDLRTDLGEPELSFVAGELIPSFAAKKKHAETINASIRTLGKRVPLAAGVNADGISHKAGDTTHISSAGLREFGKRYAHVMLAINDAGGASNPRVNNERPEKVKGQIKRIHPHALKLILRGQKAEAIEYLEASAEAKVNPEHTKLLMDIAKDRPGAWKYDAKTWPWPRTLPDTSLKKDAPSDKFTIAFGGGAGYVPDHERMWDTIRELDPRALLLLGDNVYIDDPQTPQMQRFHYYRRQSQPEWAKLAKRVPIYAIWDDHDFTTNDGWGGPDIDKPAWKRDVWNVFKENWDNPYYGGGDAQPGCWHDFRIGDVHFVMLDGRYYRESPRNNDPSMLGPAQMKWLKKTLTEKPATFTVICSNVPIAPGVKKGSKDTWDGYAGERQRIYEFIAEQKIPGVIVLSADRHRSDAYKIDTGVDGLYPIYEFQSSRLTNQHVHGLIKSSLFGYNKKQSFGRVDFDLTADDPTVTYTIINIDGEKIHSLTIKRSELRFE